MVPFNTIRKIDAWLRDGVVAWSSDGNVWFPIPKLSSLSLPANQQDGYFVNADGSISILTRHFTLFGWRKAQSALSLSASATTVQLGATTTLTTTGGTGTGALKYATSTATQCSVSDAGVVTALAAGSCQITVTKLATLNLLSATQTITLTISDSEAKAKAEAEAKAKAEAEAKAKAEAEAKAKAEALVSRFITVGSKTNGKTPVRVNLPSSFKGQRAILERATGDQGFKLVFTQVLNARGNATFQVSSAIKSGDALRIRIGNRSIASIDIP